MQKISPFLWFDDQAEEAMNFYVSIFDNSKVGKITRYGDAGPGPKGSVMTGSLELEGQQFTALNGGAHFKFTGSKAPWHEITDSLPQYAELPPAEALAT
jgi:predicted 3-demethylubiquinone-9 3-methyltransferase (glyoxalase superfamily)